MARRHLLLQNHLEATGDGWEKVNERGASVFVSLMHLENRMCQVEVWALGPPTAIRPDLSSFLAVSQITLGHQ